MWSFCLIYLRAICLDGYDEEFLAICLEFSCGPIETFDLLNFGWLFDLSDGN